MLGMAARMIITPMKMAMQTSRRVNAAGRGRSAECGFAGPDASRKIAFGLGFTTRRRGGWITDNAEFFNRRLTQINADFYGESGLIKIRLWGAQIRDLLEGRASEFFNLCLSA